MKSIKEKYEAALAVAQETYKTQPMYREWLAKMFPELKESKDEMIRKEIQSAIEQLDKDSTICGKKYDYNQWLAWLEKQGEQIDITNKEYWRGYREGKKEILDKYAEIEKQGEQKPAWSEEDKIALGDALWCCKQAASIAKDENDMGSVWYAETWLKSIKDRCVLQPKQEWSEEDEKKRRLLISILEVNHPNGYFKVNPANTLNMEAMHTEELVSWLKSLRPQNTWKPSDELDEASYHVGVKRVLENPGSYGLTKYNWKPSDEQMERLKGIINSLPHQEVLYSLYQDLKKLREE